MLPTFTWGRLRRLKQAEPGNFIITGFKIKTSHKMLVGINTIQEEGALAKESSVAEEVQEISVFHAQPQWIRVGDSHNWFVWGHHGRKRAGLLLRRRRVELLLPDLL